MCRCGTLIPGPKRSGHDESVCFSNQPERREGGENQAERVGAAESVNEGLQRAETSLVTFSGSALSRSRYRIQVGRADRSFRLANDAATDALGMLAFAGAPSAHRRSRAG